MGGHPEFPRRYQPVRMLGEGGSGQVWLCRDSESANREVAIKILLESQDEDEFRKEFATLATLIHPNLPETYGFGETGSGSCYIALEYIDGVAFVDAVQADQASFLQLASESFLALSFIHDFGLVHRDLKPQNLLVRRKPRNGFWVALLDFGLAESRRQTKRGAAGTLRYMAPELFEGATPSIKTDLYALGVVFVEALVGHSPIDVDPADDLSTYLRAIRKPVSSERLSIPVPQGVLGWLNTLRSHDPDKRPVDSREALAQLRAVVDSPIGMESEATRAARVTSGPPPGRQKVASEIFEALLDPDIAVVFLTGEAGAGKTRILDAVRVGGVQRGWNVETVFDSLTTSNLNKGAQRIRLLLIDELENATPELGMLLASIIRKPARDHQVKIVASGRAEEITDPSIKALISDAELVPSATRFDLGPLDRAGVEEILRRVFGGEPARAQVSQVLEATNGLAATVEALVVTGDKQSAKGADRLRSSVQSRLASVSDPARRCAAALAVVGEAASVGLLGAILDVDEAQLLEPLEELTSCKLVRELEGCWSLVSGLVSRVIVEQVDSATLRHVSEQAVDAIVQGSGSGSDAKLARLWRRLGDPERAVHFAVRSAETALTTESYELAAHWYAQAVLDLPKHDPRYGEFRLEHAKASEKAEAFRSAAKSYAAYVRHAKSNQSETLSKQARALLKAGRSKTALRVARAARVAALDTREQRLADAQLAGAYIFCGKPERGYEILDELAPKLDSMGAFQWGGEAYYALGVALEKTRQLEDATEAYRFAAKYAEDHNFLDVLVNSLISHANVDYKQGDPYLCLERLKRARQLSVEHRLERQTMWIMASTGRAYQVLGQYDRALACYEEVRTRSQFLGNRTQYLTAQFIIAEILIILGRPAQARTLLDGFIKGPSEPEPRVFATLTLAEALVEYIEADETEISRVLNSVLDQGIQPQLAVWGHAIVTLEWHARFGTQPTSELWKKFQASLKEEGLEPVLKARGWLAWSKEKVRCKDRKAALDACNKALEALNGRHHDLAAQIYLSMSKAHQLDSRAVEANLALEKGREELETAANLIEDEELRADFLARPVFKELRKKRESFADAEERLGALYDMVHALNSGDDPEGRLGIILDQALRVVRAERGLILLRSEGDDRYRVRLARNLEEDTVEEAAQFSRRAVLAAGKGEPVLAIHTASDERVRRMKSVSAYGIKSLLCVPFRLRDELIGAVYADSRADGALFSKKDLAFLEAFADHAALALENAREVRRLEQRKSQLLSASEARDGLGDLVGRSPAMQKVYDMIERVAESDLPVLIQGDSGTGKELVAREIYRRSLRKEKPFLSENCAAIADSLLESELFGHVKGAFTGADKDKAGLFEQVDGGTLFLDEVGDMSPAMQARLLRVLQDGELRRVGGDTTTQVDVRLVTATHRDLSRRVAEGEFREDLLYRLQVLVIHLPPLKERPADIEQLVEHFLERIARQRGQKKIPIRRDAMELLERYGWPGNVRQLENTLQRLALLAGDGAIDRSTIEQDPSLAAALIGQAGKPTLSLKQNERDRIAEALRQAGGNRNDAAKLLGVSRATIFRKIKQYGLS